MIFPIKELQLSACYIVSRTKAERINLAPVLQAEVERPLLDPDLDRLFADRDMAK